MFFSPPTEFAFHYPSRHLAKHLQERAETSGATGLIRSQLAQAMSPIVIIGDSITEAALLPSSVCGHDVVNAGIGGMTVGSYLPLAKQLLAGRRVQSIVIALVTNDSGVLSTAHIEQECQSDR